MSSTSHVETRSARNISAAGTPLKTRSALAAATYKPYFVYLMACSIPSTKMRRMFTHIGKSREPVRKVLRHNEGMVTSHKRSTRSSAPHWRLEEWVGPFATRRDARLFQTSWFRNTKGVKTRMERGIQLANEYNVICYTPRAVLADIANGGGGGASPNISITFDK